MQSDAEAVANAESCVLADAERHMAEYEGWDDLYDEDWGLNYMPAWLDYEPDDDLPEW